MAQRLATEHEHVLEAVARWLEEHPEKMRQRRETVEHPFGTIKLWMGYTHFQMKTLKKVGAEMALHVLAYNIKRVINIMGIGPLIAAMRVVVRQRASVTATISIGSTRRKLLKNAPDSVIAEASPRDHGSHLVGGQFITPPTGARFPEKTCYLEVAGRQTTIIHNGSGSMQIINPVNSFNAND
jgi:hypothetical protein